MFKLAALALLAACAITMTDGLAVMSVDLGSEFMKIAIVKPGVPMEIALNKDSRRKSPMVVSMRNGERNFGDAALSTSVKFPKLAFNFFLELLGKSADNPLVKLYKERFPYYQYKTDPETNHLIFKYDEETEYSVEELLAMILEYAKETAEHFAEQPISDAVITVPPYFNQAERRALFRAAEMSGLKVLQLMNTPTAVALNYGIFRRKEFSTAALHYIFYDIGSSSTTATVVAYQMVKAKNPATGILETNPQLTIKGMGFDRTLGGLEFQLRLRDHLAREFNKQKKTPTDVFTSPRAMAKLFKEAGRLKHILSANTDFYSQVESLLDDQDFRVKVTREDFENMCADLFLRVTQPIKEAIASSEVTWDEINEVILMGAGTRIPKIQEELKTVVKSGELGKSINTDEAAALGAVYQAAHLSKGFKVKPFNIKEANMYPIQVEFERVKSDGNGEDSVKTVKRTLFGRNNPYPQKKVMTFNKNMNDFSFDVNYGDLSFLPEEDLSILGKTKLQSVALSGIAPAIEKNKDTAEAKGVKAHFRMDDSGLLTLDKVESVFEKPADEEPEKSESTLSKIGSYLFGSSDEKDEGKVEQEADGAEQINATETEPETQKEVDPTETKEEAKTETDKTTEKPESEKTEKEADPPKEEETKEEKKEEKESGDAEKKEEEEKETKKEETEQTKDETKKDTETPKTDTKEENKNATTEEVKKATKPVTIKEPIEADIKLLDILEPSQERIDKSKKLIKELKKKDEEKVQLAKATNELEAYIFDAQDRIFQKDYKKCSTDDERNVLSGKMAEASDWMYDQDDNTKKEDYKEKLRDLKKATKDLYGRVKEYQERPKAMEAMKNMLNYSEGFLVGMQNFTGEDQPFTKVELETLQKLIGETQEWKDTVEVEMKKMDLTEKPKYVLEDFGRKMSDLDREVKYLINKAKTFKPKPKPTEEPKKDKKTEDKNTSEGIKINGVKIDGVDIDGVKIVSDGVKVETSGNVHTEEEQLKPPPVEDTETTDDKKAEEPLELGDSTKTDEPTKEGETKTNKDSNNSHNPDDEL